MTGMFDVERCVDIQVQVTPYAPERCVPKMTSSGSWGQLTRSRRHRAFVLARLTRRAPSHTQNNFERSNPRKATRQLIPCVWFTSSRTTDKMGSASEHFLARVFLRTITYPVTPTYLAPSVDKSWLSPGQSGLQPSNPVTNKLSDRSTEFHLLFGIVTLGRSTLLDQCQQMIKWVSLTLHTTLLKLISLRRRSSIKSSFACIRVSTGFLLDRRMCLQGTDRILYFLSTCFDMRVSKNLGAE